MPGGIWILLNFGPMKVKGYSYTKVIDYRATAHAPDVTTCARE